MDQQRDMVVYVRRLPERDGQPTMAGSGSPSA